MPAMRCLTHSQPVASKCALVPQARPFALRVVAPRHSLQPVLHRHTAVYAAEESRGPFQGTYGPWEVTDQDLTEVFAYRAGLNVTAAAFGLGTLAYLVPGGESLAAGPAGNVLAVGGAAGLGASLFLIHIYVTPLKRLLQIFWALGVGGGAWLMLTQGGASLPEVVATQPWAVWLVGPAFAALTGVSFKEGLCYGKPEAAALTFLIPGLLLGHLSGLLAGQPAEKALAVVVAGLLAVFAGRKWTQRVRDDIGDGSVFAFYKLPEAEQEAVLVRLRAEGGEGF